MRWPTTTEAITAILILLIVLSVYRAHKSQTIDFNLFDLLMENGRVSRIACITMGTWSALVYVFIGTYLDGKMTEGLYTAFGGLCFAPLIARMFANTPSAPPASMSTTVVTQTTT